MSLVIHKNTMMQYALIYLMLILNQSHIQRIFIGPSAGVSLTIIFFLLAYLIFCHRHRAANGMLFCLFILLSVVFIRFTQGGIGLGFCYEIILKVLIVYAAILSNPQKFMTRFIKVVVVFAVISIFGWIQQIVGLDLMSKLAPAYRDYSTQYSWVNGYRIERPLYVHGILLYTTSDWEPMRNVGIFTEPGIYQMILNTALCVLLFFADKVHIKEKTKKRYTVILVLTVLTTQSTTGYFAIAFLFLCSLLFDKSAHSGQKKNIITFIVAGVTVLAGDFLFRGEDSLFYKAIISKVFSEGTFSITESTGIYRMAGIGMAIKAMIENPFGLGVDKWDIFKAQSLVGTVGGFPFVLGAILGVIPLAITLIWIFSPLKYIKKNVIGIIVIVFLYFNTSLAQTSAFYPTLIMLPIYFSIMKSNHVYKCDLEKEK